MITITLHLAACGSIPTSTPGIDIQIALQPVESSLAPRFFADDEGFSFIPPSGWEASTLPGSDTQIEFIDPLTDAVMRYSLYGGESARSFDVKTFLEKVFPELSPSASGTSSTEKFTFADGANGWWFEGEFHPPYSEWKSYIIVARDVDQGVAALLFLIPPGTNDDIQSTTAEAARTVFPIPSSPLEIGRENALHFSSGEPLTLDPALTHFGASGLMGDIFSGLVVLDPDLKVRPALAESWEVSPDGTTYRFKISPHAKFHNGRRVTADDVIFSWERAASPEMGSETALIYMGDIIGLAEYHAGEADHIEGIKRIDDLTLEVSIDAPKPYFLAKLTYPVSWVVDRFNIQYPNWKSHPNGTGPFRHLQHLEDEVFILERNPYYYRDPPLIDHIVYLMYAGYSQRLYESGEIDLTGITRDQIERAQNPSDALFGTLYSETGLCTSFVTFNNRMPPFDDPDVRQAFVHAIDREVYVEALTDNEALAGHGLLPPGMPGFNEELSAPAFDPDYARALLHRSAYFDGTQPTPEITWTLPVSGGRYSPAAAFLVENWRDILGVEILVEGIDWEDYYDQVDAGNYGQLLFEGWCADYPDPENFFDVLFHSQSPQNHAYYSNPDYDRLVESARAEPVLEERLKLYQDAEIILLEDAPVLFISHSSPSYFVWNPRVHGYIPSPIGVPQNASLWISE